MRFVDAAHLTTCCSPDVNRQGPRFSIRMIIWIFCSDTETGAVTPLGRGAETLTAPKILLLSLIADVKQL